MDRLAVTDADGREIGSITLTDGQAVGSNESIQATFDILARNGDYTPAECFAQLAKGWTNGYLSIG
jgi:hypothetical protein